MCACSRPRGLLAVLIGLATLGIFASRADPAARPSYLLVSLPSLGTVTWRCGERPRTYGLAFRVFRTAATTDLRFVAGARVRARRTAQPGKTQRLPLAGLSQRLELVQATGAGTLRATVSVRFDRAPVVSYCYRYAPPHVVVHVTPRGYR